MPTTTSTPTKGKVFIGTVLSDKMNSTIVVVVSARQRHLRYQKIYETKTKLYADNNLKAKIGDQVKIKECRPLSKLKRFTTLEIIK